MTDVMVVFVAGMGRSGSTLIARALGQVPGLVTVGELHYLWDQSILMDRACACGQPFSTCEFWQSVGASAFGGWDVTEATELLEIRKRLIRNRYAPLLVSSVVPASVRSDRDRYAEAMRGVYQGVCDVSGAEGVVDSSKYPSAGFVLASSEKVDLRLLHLVRRSQGVAYSWMKKVARPDRKDRDLARFPPTRTSIEWLAWNMAYDVLRLGRDHQSIMRYEDFVAYPRPTLAATLEDLGLSRTPEQLGFVQGNEIVMEDHHSLAGNPNRFQQGRQTLRVDDAWRREMPASTRRLVTAMTWPGLIRYGYVSRGQ